MKGPGMRLDLDVRRLWRCPACSTQRQTPGRVTFVRCHFCKDHPAMVLVERPRPPRPPRPPLDLIIDLHPDDVNAPAFVPLHLREPEPQESPAEHPAEVRLELTPSPPPAEPTSAQPTSAEATSTEPASAEPVAAATQQIPEQPPAPHVVAEPEADQASPPPGRKKRRSRRQRRRGRSAGPGEAPQSASVDAPPARPSDESSGAASAK